MLKDIGAASLTTDQDIIRLLPARLQERASLSGEEYAWHPTDIPLVIKSGAELNLLNIGGQLQFRLPEGGTAECYWVEVDTFRDVPTNLSWDERVRLAETSAQKQFSDLQAKFDFVTEGKKAFAEYLGKFEDAGGDLDKAVWFVWYFESWTGCGAKPSH